MHTTKILAILLLLFMVMGPAQALENSFIKYGSLNVYSEVPGVEIYVDGVLQGKDLVKLEKVQIGSHLVKAAGGDQEIFSEIVKVEEGALSTVVINEKKPTLAEPLPSPATVETKVTNFKPHTLSVGYQSQSVSGGGSSSINGNGFDVAYRYSIPLASFLFTDLSLGYSNTNLNTSLKFPMNLVDLGVGLRNKTTFGDFSLFTGMDFLYGYMSYAYNSYGTAVSGTGTGPGFGLIMGYEYQLLNMTLKYSYLSISSTATASGYGSYSSVMNFANIILNVGFPF